MTNLHKTWDVEANILAPLVPIRCPQKYRQVMYRQISSPIASKIFLEGQSETELVNYKQENRGHARDYRPTNVVLGKSLEMDGSYNRAISNG